jgi:hypothetical protein
MPIAVVAYDAWPEQFLRGLRAGGLDGVTLAATQAAVSIWWYRVG